MTDEIRIYHVDDPNDAPERRMAAFPTINPFIPLSLPQCVIPPVAGAIQYAMQYWSLYSAYQQGVARGQQQAEQQQRPHESPQSHHYQHHHQQQHLLHHHESRLHHHQSHLTPAAPTTTNLTPQLNCTQPQHDSPPSLSAASTAQMASSSSSSSSSSASTSSSASSIDSGSPQTPTMSHPHYSVNSRDYQDQPRRLHKTPPNQEHIKKPLNPFMIFMQKQRPEIVRQGIIKESAAINQLLGQQWRKLSREEQEPYYKLAEQEKILHAQKYPGWSARDNYANQKKRKKLKLKSISLNGLDQSDKKCRARFGLNNLGSWCKPCKRKKKCIYSIRSNSNTNPMRKLEPNAHNKMVVYQ